MNVVAPEVATNFDALVAGAVASAPLKGEPWLAERRQAAADAFRELGWPTRRSEAWRYTTLKPLLETEFVASGPFHAVQSEDIEDLNIDGFDGYKLVMVNGHFEPSLCNFAGLPEGVTLDGLHNAITRNLACTSEYLGKVAPADAAVFTALNMAAADDGAVLHIPAGVSLDKPLQLLHISVSQEEAAISQPRLLIRLDEGASATVIERYAGVGDSPATSFTNAVTEVSLGKGAELDHHRVQDDNLGAFHVSRLAIQQAGESKYNSVQLSLGGKWSRTDVVAGFTGEGAQCDLAGLYAVRDGQLTDFHLDIHHDVPGCNSTENYRGIVAGRGRGVFDGRIYVARDAQQTDAQLKNDNLLLSRSAEIDTKPQLEIYADDVACSHGTTVGELDAETIFYLRSRGITHARAKQLVCLGFAREVVETCKDEHLHDWMDALVERRLIGLLEQLETE